MNESEKFSNDVRHCAICLREHGVSGLSALFDLTAVRLVRLAVTITRNQHDAEDAVQLALVRVAEQPRRLSEADQPWHYLLRMVRNQALVILRKRKRSVTLDSLLVDLRTESSVDQAELAETYQAVWGALRALPASQSEVVVLKVWEGMTFEQIGAVLDVSSSTAASRYRYALTKLSQRLANETPDDSVKVREQLGGRHA